MHWARVAPIAGLDNLGTWQAPSPHFPFTLAADIMPVFETSLKTSAHPHVYYDPTIFVPAILIGSYAAE